MNSTREICIIARKTIIKGVALLYNGILLFRAQGRATIPTNLQTEKSKFQPHSGYMLAGTKTLFHIQISM